jgi:hypothetical protein
MVEEGMGCAPDDAQRLPGSHTAVGLGITGCFESKHPVYLAILPRHFSTVMLDYL